MTRSGVCNENTRNSQALWSRLVASTTLGQDQQHILRSLFVGWIDRAPIFAIQSWRKASMANLWGFSRSQCVYGSPVEISNCVMTAGYLHERREVDGKAVARAGKASRNGSSGRLNVSGKQMFIQSRNSIPGNTWKPVFPQNTASWTDLSFSTCPALTAIYPFSLLSKLSIVLFEKRNRSFGVLNTLCWVA